MYEISEDDKQLYDDGVLSLQGLVTAYQAQDPRLAEYACKLVELDPYPVKLVQVSRKTCMIAGHRRQGMSTVYQAIQELYGRKDDGLLREGDEKFVYSNVNQEQFVLIDGTEFVAGYGIPSVEELQQAQVVCVVVACDDGVLSETRTLVERTREANVSKVVVYINKVDEFAESERAQMIALVQQEVADLLQTHGFDAGPEVFVSGSARDAYYEEDTAIGLQSIERLNTVLNDSISPIVITENQSLMGYKKFREDYHKDAIDSDVLADIQPRYPKVNTRYPHQLLRQQKAELFTQRFNHFVQTQPHHVPERIKVGEFMLMLYDDNSLYASEQLLEMVQNIPLKWGPWQAFKYIMKRGILDQRWTLFAMSYNRWKETTGYIYSERLWNGTVRRRDLHGKYLPNDVMELDWSDPYDYWSSDALSSLDSGIEITKETRKFLNKMFSRLYHEQFALLSNETQEAITAEVLMVAPSFRNWWSNRDIWAEWADDLVWGSSQSGDALIRLWEQAVCEDIRDWAFEQLLGNHATRLKNLPVEWIVAQGTNSSVSSGIRSFVIDWICDPMTDIPKASFVDCELHKVIMTFLDSDFGRLRDRTVQYACDFVRQFMDRMVDFIDLDKVLWLLRHNRTDVHELGLFLLFPDGEKQSPYQDQLNLDFWTGLLSDNRMHSYAVKSIKERFKNQIGLEWLKGRLYAFERREVNLAKTFIREGIHQSNLDFYPVYYTNVFSNPGRHSLYDWAWEALNREDVDGNSLLKDRFTVVDYRKMLMSDSDTNVESAINAYRNEVVSEVDFPISFLKHLISADEYSRNVWKSFLKETLEPSERWKAEVSQRHPYRLSSTLKSFANEVVFGRTDCTVQTLGYRWVLERRAKSGTSYQRVREMFQSDFPNYALQLLNSSIDESSLEDTPESNVAGVQQVLNKLEQGLYYNSNDARFWRTFLFSRLARQAEINQQPFEKEDVCTVSPDHFSLNWFMDEVANEDKSEYHQDFALNLAKLYFSDWIEKYRADGEIFGFTEMIPLFGENRSVRDFVEKCITSPETEFAKIDLMDDDFTPEALFEYCYSTESFIRSLGLRFIQEYPGKFAQPDKLVELTTSPDPNVRALVIQILYQIAHIPLVTPNWSPYENSVIPGNMERSGRDKMQTSTSFPTRFSQVGGVKYLGSGTPENIEPALTDHGQLVLFAIRQLFLLPPNPRKKGERSEEKVPSWKTKRLLIDSFRDLALQDRTFAEAIVPVFQELTTYKGKIVRESVWSALAYIDAKYTNQPIESLTAFN